METEWTGVKKLTEKATDWEEMGERREREREKTTWRGPRQFVRPLATSSLDYRADRRRRCHYGRDLYRRRRRLLLHSLG